MRYLAIPAALILAGCAHVDTGQVDYRVADPGICVPKAGECLAKLTHKYRPEQRPFVVGDVYSVELEQAMIGPKLLEGVIFGVETGKRGQFAILANSFEQDEKGSYRFVEAIDYDKPGDKVKSKLKLIHFADDVARRQYFNFSNIPLTPRAKYSGGTFGIQIVVKEIDAGSKGVASLLTTLAAYGKTLVPAAPPVSNLLFDLGGSLFEGGKDDRILDYRFELRNAGAVSPSGEISASAGFAPGKYIIRKSDNRAGDTDWGSFEYDYETGRVRRRSGGNSAGPEFRDDLYLVLNITRYDKETKAEGYDFYDWEAVRAALQTADQTSAPLDVAVRHLTGMAIKGRSTQLKAGLIEGWQAVDHAMKTLSSQHDKSEYAILKDCAAEGQIRKIRDNSIQDLYRSTRDFVDAYKIALKNAATAGPEKHEIWTGDRDKVISFVARSFTPWDNGGTEFQDIEGFEKAYITGDRNALAVKAIKAAKERGLDKITCETAMSIVAKA